MGLYSITHTQQGLVLYCPIKQWSLSAIFLLLLLHSILFHSTPLHSTLLHPTLSNLASAPWDAQLNNEHTKPNPGLLLIETHTHLLPDHLPVACAKLPDR